MHRYLLLFFLNLGIPSFNYAQDKNDKITVADGLTLISLSPHTYQHVSEMETNDFGRVLCNGLIYINNKEALICDTPPTAELSAKLLSWVKENHPNVKIKAVVINHFHADCLGGLREFHKAGITSYAHTLTPELLKINKDTFDIPQHTFSTTTNLKIGVEKVSIHFMGEGHTKDNIITWIPSVNTIFGGCLIKSMQAGKGYLGDANVKEWSNTVNRIKSKFPSATIVIPGHGESGGTELLDYTIKLFDGDR